MTKFISSTPLRRSSRLHLRVPVRVSGILPDGKSFTEEVNIVSISKYGAKLETRLPFRIGMEIKVQLRQRRQAAAFRVVWMGGEDTPRAGEVGIEYVRVSDLLGVAFPE